jgi:tetratricopeptide (TPR) repeat protein
VRFPSAGNLTSLINVLYIQRKDDEAFIGTSDHPELARVYQELGQADSAIAVYERYLGVRSLTRLSLDAIELGGALEQLAALYEMRGDRTKAAAQSHRLAELWRHADAAVQPRVEAARRRARPPD